MESGPVTIAHVDAESGFSGGEAQVFLLMRGLARRGWRNVLVAPTTSASTARARSEGIEVLPVSMRNDLDLLAIVRLRRAFRASGASLVHLHSGRATWLGGWAARLAGVPAITTRRMDRDVRRSVRTELVYRTLTRRVAAISSSVMRSLEEGGVPRERIRLITDAIDPDAFRAKRSRDDVRAELGARAEDVVVVAVGALVARKGIDVLLRALAELDRRGVRPLAWIAGDGEERAALERSSRELGLSDRVRFLGVRSDVAELLHAADVFAMPSRREGMGVAALEALAAGCATVASRVGGLAEVVLEGRTGSLVAPENASELATALEVLVRDSDRRAAFGRAGPARVRELFHVDLMVGAYEALYREVLDESARARAPSSNRRADA